MNSLQFKRNEFKKLCSSVGFTPTEVKYFIKNIDSYYKEWIEEKVDKKTGEFKKYRDGTIKIRTIRPSLHEFKKIQDNIKNRILTPIALPDCVHGGVKGRSNITNARPHKGNKFQFTTDLQEFYPNISSKQVYHAFLNVHFSPHYSHWLTKLTTWKYELPQGTPTSTHVANIVFMKTDLKLLSLCQELGITYTRFVDDMTFSSQQDFSIYLNKILEIVKNDDFKINYRKTKYCGNQTITGIEVSLNKIEAPERIIQRSIIEIETDSKTKPYTNYLNNIRKANKKKNKNPSEQSQSRC